MERETVSWERTLGGPPSSESKLPHWTSYAGRLGREQALAVAIRSWREGRYTMVCAKKEEGELIAEQTPDGGFKVSLRRSSGNREYRPAEKEDKAFLRLVIKRFHEATTNPPAEGGQHVDRHVLLETLSNFLKRLEPEG